jgi:hypothetical protein
MNNFNTNTTNNDTWLTPPELIKSLGEFDLDPCSPVDRPWDTAKKHYTIHDDGLKQPWAGRVWLNPPYGKSTFVWMDRLATHKSGIALIFARTETIGFQEYVFGKAKSLFFFKGRLQFYTLEGKKADSANAPSVLVSYSDYDSDMIDLAAKNGSIKGKHVLLNHNP